MKRFLSISIAAIYLLIITGLQVTAHYCHGELESVKIIVENDPCCCSNGEMDNNCCSNDNISFQADIDNHLAAENKIILEQYQVYAVVLYSITDILIETEEEQIAVYSFGIPPIQYQPLWLLNCSLTYYG